MKVLLIQDVDNLGFAGEIKEVATGYGRNYLIPQGMAVLATEGALQEADLHRRRADERRQRLADELAALARAVDQTTLVFQAKAGPTGRLYGSVTSAEIADQLAEAVAHDIDRRRIIMEGPIKDLGSHEVTLRLGTDLSAEFVVVVESIDGEVVPEAAEAIIDDDAEVEVAAAESLDAPEAVEAEAPVPEE